MISGPRSVDTDEVSTTKVGSRNRQGPIVRVFPEHETRSCVLTASVDDDAGLSSRR
jgi:hypothetical protein